MQSQPTEEGSRIRLTKPGSKPVFRPLACLLYRTCSLYRRLSGVSLRDRPAVFKLSSASGQEETSPEVKQAALWKIRLRLRLKDKEACLG